MRVFKVALAITAPMLIGLLPARPAGASGEAVTVATHNIQHDYWGALNYVAENDRPLMMMGQEVCSAALNALMIRIDDLGYGRNSFRQVSNSSSCGGDSLFTVAITQAWTNVTGEAYHPGTLTHGWSCIRGWYGSYWRSCSTHMNPNDYPLAYQQSEYLRVWAVPPDSVPTIFGGDFNLRPRGYSGYNTSNWRGSYYEGDNTCYARGMDRRTLKPGPLYSSCPIGGSEAGVKIDYTWAAILFYDQVFGVADIRCNTASDHCLYFATYRWN